MREKRPYEASIQARADLRHIYAYIQENNPTAADKLEAKFYAMFEKLARFPQMGHRREDIPSPLRVWNMGRYLIIYDPSASPLTIVRIVSAYRNMARVMN